MINGIAISPFSTQEILTGVLVPPSGEKIKIIEQVQTNYIKIIEQSQPNNFIKITE